jgi:hypothetical protein
VREEVSTEEVVVVVRCSQKAAGLRVVVWGEGMEAELAPGPYHCCLVVVVEEEAQEIEGLMPQLFLLRLLLSISEQCLHHLKQ